MSLTNANGTVEAEEAVFNETSDELTAPLRTSSNNEEDDDNTPEHTVDRNSSERESAAEMKKDQSQQSSSSTADEQAGPSSPTKSYELFCRPLPVSDLAQSQSSGQAGPQQDAASGLAQPAQPQSSGQTGSQKAPDIIDIEEKRKLIQQQLLLFLHSHSCSRRMTVDSQWRCDRLHCKTMRGVLDHMPNCREGKACQVAHCAGTRQIIGHWKHCKRLDCPLCQPIREAESNLLSSIKHSTLVQNFAQAAGVDWPVPFALRSLIRMKVVEAITPPSNNPAFTALDPRMDSLNEVIRLIERHIFELANSNEEYTHLLADKIYDILGQLAQRSQERRRRYNLRAAVSPLGDREQRLQRQPQRPRQRPSATTPPGS